MSVFFLNSVNSLTPDLICPHCGQSLEVENQEEPNDGIEIKTCPKCSKKIKVETKIVIEYSASVI